MEKASVDTNAKNATSNDITRMIPNLKKESANVKKLNQKKKLNKSLPKGKKTLVKKSMIKPKKAVNILKLPHVALEEMPRQGYLCRRRAYYICRNNDTYKSIAKKLGMKDWKILSIVNFNVKKYGLQGCVAAFKPNTIIRIPTNQCSKWKMDKLTDVEMEDLEAMATCSQCFKKEKECDTDEMLLCDGCNLEIHLSCAGLSSVPTGDWLCENCLEVLRARKEQLDKNPNFCVPSLPKMEELPSQIASISTIASDRKTAFLEAKKKCLIRQMEMNDEVLRLALVAIRESLQIELDFAIAHVIHLRQDYERSISAFQQIYRNDDTSERLPITEQRLQQKRQERDAKQELVNKAEEELGQHDKYCTEKKNEILLGYAALQGECKLPFESKKYFKKRENDGPLFLGLVTLTENDIVYINLLTEPTELVLVIPTDDIDYIADFKVESGKQYYLFGTPKLFSKKRDDSLPMNMTDRASSVRNAQRELISILLRDPRNAYMQVSQPYVPSSVNTRGKKDEDESAVRKYFDLNELVRDCNYPIEDQPSIETPKALADHGLELRDYQKCSLKWMVDKEQNPTGLGSTGEVWACFRTLDADSSTRSYYYYCNLTGSIVQKIFDYRTDIQQKNASYQFGKYPSYGILGEEMGLGKTIIALSLIVASPPPLQIRVLPHEHIVKISHTEYLAPISPLGYICPHVKKVFLSNGTLVIAPMTLCSQWQSEIEKFAPFMSVLTLHNDETQSVEEIASKDVIIASTFLLQSQGKKLLSKLKRIHFHRILLDESHYNNSGEKIKKELATLSASHRYCLTGTPVGHSLQDLYGQVSNIDSISKFA